MNTAKSGDKVKVVYTICLDNGTRFRPLHSGDTLEFRVGRNAVLAGFERAVLGMAEGDTRQVKVPAAEAYGPHRPDKIFTLPRYEVLPQVEPLSVGDVVRVASAEEGEFFAVIRELDSTEVLLDANHPLCGQDITFEIHLLEVTEPVAATGSIEAGRSLNNALHAASGL